MAEKHLVLKDLFGSALETDPTDKEENILGWWFESTPKIQQNEDKSKEEEKN